MQLKGDFSFTWGYDVCDRHKDTYKIVLSLDNNKHSCFLRWGKWQLSHRFSNGSAFPARHGQSSLWWLQLHPLEAGRQTAVLWVLQAACTQATMVTLLLGGFAWPP